MATTRYCVRWYRKIGPALEEDLGLEVEDGTRQECMDYIRNMRNQIRADGDGKKVFRKFDNLKTKLAVQAVMSNGTTVDHRWAMEKVEPPNQD